MIKDILRDFIIENLPAEFSCYWSGDRATEPQKPFCILTDLADSQTKRTSEYSEGLNQISTQYIQSVITIGVYVSGLDDYDIQNQYAIDTIKKLRQVFDTKQTTERFKKYFSINNLTGIRPLNEPISGGFIYRHEFDLTIGINSEYIYELKKSKRVIIELNNNEHIEVGGD